MGTWVKVRRDLVVDVGKVKGLELEDERRRHWWVEKGSKNPQKGKCFSLREKPTILAFPIWLKILENKW